MPEDPYYRLPNGVRKPDPTLGRKPPEPEPIIAEVLQELTRTEPEHAKPKRQRVILADPRQAASTLRARVELEEQTSWGELLIKNLVKAQLRTGLLLSLLVIVLLGSLPALFYALPGFARFAV